LREHVAGAITPANLLPRRKPVPKETIDLGASPDEPRAQPSEPRFREKNVGECLAYAKAIRRYCGEPPDGVVLRLDTEDEAACRYAQYCQEMGPRTWTESWLGPHSAWGQGRS
jgi:hypothetical protein